jgi:hexulose-6-phosphate isomerase
VRDIPYGEGTVDFVSFFGLIRKMDYKGLLVAEMWATADREASIGYIRAAREFLLEKYREAVGDESASLISRDSSAGEASAEGA